MKSKLVGIVSRPLWKPRTVFLSFPHGHVTSSDYPNDRSREGLSSDYRKGSQAQQSLVCYLRSHDREVVQLGLDSTSSGLLSAPHFHTRHWWEGQREVWRGIGWGLATDLTAFWRQCPLLGGGTDLSEVSRQDRKSSTCITDCYIISVRTFRSTGPSIKHP